MRIYVAEINENRIEDLRTFPDTRKGEKEAMAHFSDLLESYGIKAVADSRTVDIGESRTVCWGRVE